MLVLAEVGINHNGDVDLAKEMIYAAKYAGADIVKFQKRTPELCVPKHQQNVLRETPWGVMTYLNYKKRIEFQREEYDEIDDYCKRINIPWTASVWDIPSAAFINTYDVPLIKIASASITDFALLEYVSRLDIPIVMSTGMSTIKEIHEAVEILKDTDLTILHCVSGYPTPSSDLNLNKIKTLRKIFPECKIGYSGHEIGILPTIIARTLGAETIERHFTTDCSMWGSDQSISLEPEMFKNMVQLLREVPEFLGNGKIEVMPSEVECRKKLRGV